VNAELHGRRSCYWCDALWSAVAGGAKAPQMDRRPDTTETHSPDRSAPKPGKLAERRVREAEALRANLRKRKDQARAREKPKQE